MKHLGPFRTVMLRDLASALVAVACWAWVLSTREHPSGVATASTVLSTLVCMLSTHEWGHWLGAKLSGGRVYPRASLASPFVFAFDVERSTRAQFLAMSAGGYLASFSVAGLLLAFAPRELVCSQLLLGAVGLGLVMLLIDDLPVTLRVVRGGPMPHGGLYAPSTTSDQPHRTSP